MSDNVLIATTNDSNGAHQRVVGEFLDAGGLPVAVTAANPLPVSASINPAGLATSAKQSDGSQKTQIVDGSGNAVTVTGNKLDVNATVSTVGLATSANQTTELASLASIDGKTPALGQQLAAASQPVVLTAAQITALTPPAAIAGFNLETTQALVKAKTDNIDVALSTRTKPSDQQHAIIDSGTTVVTQPTGTNLHTVVDSLPAIPAGTNVMGKVGIDQTTPGTTNKVSIGTDGTVAINAAIPAGANVIGHVIVDTVPLTPVAGQAVSSDQGHSHYRNTALSTTIVFPKAGAGNIYGFNFINVNTVPVFIKIMNIASGGTLGTTPIVKILMIPAAVDASNPGLLFMNANETPWCFASTGIAMAAVTGLADNNTSAPGTAIYAELIYK